MSTRFSAEEEAPIFRPVDSKLDSGEVRVTITPPARGSLVGTAEVRTDPISDVEKLVAAILADDPELDWPVFGED